MAVLEDLLERAKSGSLPDFAFVATLGTQPPIVGVTGGFRRDACRALGALTLMKRRLCHLHDRAAGQDSTAS